MFKLLKKLSRKELFKFFMCILVISVHVYFDLKIPDYMSKLTLLIETEGTEVIEVLKVGTHMILCALGSAICSVVVGYLAAIISSKFGQVVRKSIFEKVGEFSESEIKKFSTSSLITRTTNDVRQVQMLISMGVQVIVKAPIMAAWAILKIAGKNYAWSMATFIAVVILLSIIITLMIIVIPRFKMVQKLTDNLNLITRENLTGIRVIRAFNAEGYQKNKFEKANDKLKDTEYFTQVIMGILSPAMTLVMNGLCLAIYIIGAILISKSAVDGRLLLFSDMVTFTSYAMQVLMSFMLLVMIFVLYPRAQVSANRINEVLETESSIKSGKVKKGKEIGTVEFRNVSFKYPDAEEYMLKNISFKANRGDTVAFIGGTGSGKSTLINLIPRFYDATEGEILVDGVNVLDYDLDKLHDIIGYVPQKAVLFSGTVKSNIKFGNKKVKENEIDKVLKVAKADKFVKKMENGIDSHIAIRGTNVSGGQKQRLAISRVIARKPEIYIFDDSFSALDYKTDYELRKGLRKHTSDATSLIVASRIGTIKDADLILVLDNGDCVAQGTHESLLKECDIYKEIALSQLGEDELNA